jgi:hypothetical protein
MLSLPELLDELKKEKLPKEVYNEIFGRVFKDEIKAVEGQSRRVENGK